MFSSHRLSRYGMKEAVFRNPVHGRKEKLHVGCKAFPEEYKRCVYNVELFRFKVRMGLTTGSNDICPTMVIFYTTIILALNTREWWAFDRKWWPFQRKWWPSDRKTLPFNRNWPLCFFLMYTLTQRLLGMKCYISASINRWMTFHYLYWTNKYYSA